MKFVNKNSLAFACVFGVIGLFECFLGKKMFKPTLFIVGFVLSFVIVMALVFALLIKQDSPEWASWATVAVSLCIGLACGYLAVKFEKTGIFMIGAWLGSIIGLMIYQAGLSHLDTGYEQVHFLPHTYPILYRKSCLPPFSSAPSSSVP